MMINDRLFACHRCGKCCQELVHYSTLFGIDMGMLLLPSEMPLFPENAIGPALALGLVNKKNPQPRGMVLAQVITNVCPHFAQGRCSIYETRPTICRAYPLISQGEGPVMMPDCPHSRDTQPTEEMWAAYHRLKAYKAKVKKAGEKEALWVVGCDGKGLVFGQPEIMPTWFKR